MSNIVKFPRASKPPAPEPVQPAAPAAAPAAPKAEGRGLVAGLVKFVWVATVLVWLLAIWLVVAGIARIVFAVQMRRLVEGNWLLALSGILALLLGLLFIARPNIGVATLAVWLGIGALLYGALQVALAFYMRRRLAA